MFGAQVPSFQLDAENREEAPSWSDGGHITMPRVGSGINLLKPWSLRLGVRYVFPKEIQGAEAKRCCLSKNIHPVLSIENVS